MGQTTQMKYTVVWQDNEVNPERATVVFRDEAGREVRHLHLSPMMANYKPGDVIYLCLNGEQVFIGVPGEGWRPVWAMVKATVLRNNFVSPVLYLDAGNFAMDSTIEIIETKEDVS